MDDVAGVVPTVLVDVAADTTVFLLVVVSLIFFIGGGIVLFGIVTAVFEDGNGDGAPGEVVVVLGVGLAGMVFSSWGFRRIWGGFCDEGGDGGGVGSGGGAGDGGDDGGGVGSGDDGGLGCVSFNGAFVSWVFMTQSMQCPSVPQWSSRGVSICPDDTGC